MNIGIVTDANLNLGSGTTVRVKGLSKYMDKNVLQFIYSQTFLPKELKQNNIVHIQWKKDLLFYQLSRFFPPNNFLSKSIMEKIILKSTLLNSIMKNKPDLLFCHQHRIGQYCLALNSKRIPIVIDLHGLFFSNKSFLYLFDNYYNFFYNLNIKYEKKIFHKSDALTVVSKRFKDYLIRYFPDLKKKIYVLPNGVDINMYTKIEKTRIKNPIIKNISSLNEQIIMYVGYISPIHGVMDLIKAFEILQKKYKYRNIQLIIIGNGPSLFKIRKYISQRKIKNISILNPIPHIELPKYLRIANILVIPHVNCPQNDLIYSTKLLDYLASEKPVIISNLKSTKEMITNLKNGLIYESGNINDFVEKIIYLINNPKIAVSIGKNGRKLIKTSFDWKIIVKKEKKIFNKILSEKNIN